MIRDQGECHLCLDHVALFRLNDSLFHGTGLDDFPGELLLVLTGNGPTRLGLQLILEYGPREERGRGNLFGWGRDRGRLFDGGRRGQRVIPGLPSVLDEPLDLLGEPFGCGLRVLFGLLLRHEDFHLHLACLEVHPASPRQILGILDPVLLGGHLEVLPHGPDLTAEFFEGRLLEVVVLLLHGRYALEELTLQVVLADGLPVCEEAGEEDEGKGDSAKGQSAPRAGVIHAGLLPRPAPGRPSPPVPRCSGAPLRSDRSPVSDILRRR